MRLRRKVPPVRTHSVINRICQFQLSRRAEEEIGTRYRVEGWRQAMAVVLTREIASSTRIIPESTITILLYLLYFFYALLLLLLLLLMDLQPLFGHGRFFSISWSCKQSIGLLGRGISPIQGLPTHRITQTRIKQTQTSIPPTGFETPTSAF
jgi:hypothetical protein